MHEALRLQAARSWVIPRGPIVASTQTTTTIHGTLDVTSSDSSGQVLA